MSGLYFLTGKMKVPKQAWALTFQNFRGCSGCVTNTPRRQSQGIQNAADNKQHQEHKEQMKWKYNVFTHLCSSGIPRISLVKAKLTTYNSTSNITL